MFLVVGEGDFASREPVLGSMRCRLGSVICQQIYTRTSSIIKIPSSASPRGSSSLNVVLLFFDTAEKQENRKFLIPGGVHFTSE